MAKAQPLYTIEEQLLKLDTDLPISFKTLNFIRYRLLMACSSGGTLDAAKNRFLFLIQDTEVRTLFASLLEIPEEREIVGVNTIQDINKKFSLNYGLIDNALKELGILGVPRYTTNLLEEYFSSNEDPVYKLSIMASMVMLGYVRDDVINNRK